MSTFTVIVTPGWNFPEGQPIDLAALRQAASPTVSLEGTFSSTTIADGAITEPKHATGGVSTRALADLSVTTPKLADEAVTGPKIAPGAVTQSHITGPLDIDVLNVFNGPEGGIVPAATSNDRFSFLRGDGRWAAPDFNAAVQILMAQNYQ